MTFDNDVDDILRSVRPWARLVFAARMVAVVPTPDREHDVRPLARRRGAGSRRPAPAM